MTRVPPGRSRDSGREAEDVLDLRERIVVEHLVDHRPRRSRLPRTARRVCTRIGRPGRSRMRPPPFSTPRRRSQVRHIPTGAPAAADRAWPARSPHPARARRRPAAGRATGPRSDSAAAPGPESPESPSPRTHRPSPRLPRGCPRRDFAVPPVRDALPAMGHLAEQLSRSRQSAKPACSAQRHADDDVAGRMALRGDHREDRRGSQHQTDGDRCRLPTAGAEQDDDVRFLRPAGTGPYRGRDAPMEKGTPRNPAMSRAVNARSRRLRDPGSVLVALRVSGRR